MRDRFSLIGHAGLPLMNPLTEAELIQLLDAAELSPGGLVLDLGGGRGDLARLAAQRYRCSATSVDWSPAACEAARARTQALGVEVVCQDARTYLQLRSTASPPVALAAALGALHAFGSGLPSWTGAVEGLGPHARRVLVGDLVALGAAAAREMDVVTMGQLDPLLRRAVARVVLKPARVIAYERAWCNAVDEFLRAHPGDPRSDWALERIAWSRAPQRESAWDELAFVALLLPSADQCSAKNA